MPCSILSKYRIAALRSKTLGGHSRLDNSILIGMARGDQIVNAPTPESQEAASSMRNKCSRWRHARTGDHARRRAAIDALTKARFGRPSDWPCKGGGKS